MQTEWWTVYGSFNGHKTFDTEDAAQQYFNDRVVHDDWAGNGSIVHCQVIATHEKMTPTRDFKR